VQKWGTRERDRCKSILACTIEFITDVYTYNTVIVALSKEKEGSKKPRMC